MRNVLYRIGLWLVRRYAPSRQLSPQEQEIATSLGKIAAATPDWEPRKWSDIWDAMDQGPYVGGMS